VKAAPPGSVDERVPDMNFATIRAVAAGFLLLAPAQAVAQDKAEWDKLVAAAEAEGTIIMESQPNKNARDFLLSAWGKAYPKITLNLSVTGAPFLARIRTERAAEKYLWDIAVSGATNGYTLSKEGVLDPIAPELISPDLKDPNTWGGWDNVYFDLERKYIWAISAFLKSPYYNALNLPAEKVKAQGLKVLLDPALRGKIIWHDPSIAGSGQTLSLVMRRNLGDDGLKQMIEKQNVHFVAQQQETVEALARGTHWVSLGPMVTGLIQPYLAAGVKADIHSFGNAPQVNEMSIGGASMYIFNKRPHPNATRLFINWVLSKDVQLEFAKAMQQDSRRQDVPPISDPEKIPLRGVKYLETQREENVAHVQDAVKFIADTRKGSK
jgi:ABC-type Fe3+ transport system substrate-binding protein